MKHGPGGYSRGCRCGECREGHRSRMREYMRRRNGFYEPRETTRCERCGEAFIRPSNGGKAKRFCSRSCQQAALRPTPMSEFRRRARRDAAKAARGVRSSWAWIQGTCGECGEYFVRHGAASPFCSKRCSSADARRRRRARKAGATVTRSQRARIHERDNWTCHICGDPVNRTARVPELAAPTLDHVIALAAGGAHDESNLKTAHFYCNSVKRELPLSKVA